MPRQRPSPPSKSRVPPSAALAEHRKRLRSRGLQRLEVQVRGEDAPLLRAVVAVRRPPAHEFGMASGALGLVAGHAARGERLRHGVQDFRGRVMPGPGFRTCGNRRWRGTFHHGVEQGPARLVRMPATLDSLTPDMRGGLGADQGACRVNRAINTGDAFTLSALCFGRLAPIKPDTRLGWLIGFL